MSEDENLADAIWRSCVLDECDGLWFARAKAAALIKRHRESALAAATKQLQEISELFDCTPDRLKQEVVEAREMWDRIARLAGQKQKDAEAKLAAATKRAEEAEAMNEAWRRNCDGIANRLATSEADNVRLREGIEEVRGGCIQAAGNWNSESGVELASAARELAALLSQSEEASDGK